MTYQTIKHRVEVASRTHHKRVVAVGWIFCLSILFIHLWLYRNFFVDDAYITFRYIQQWIAGNGLVYNIGERVEGYSNLLWIVLLAPFEAIGFDLISASKLLGIMLGLLTLYTTWRFGQRFEYPFIAPLLLVSSGPFVAWIMGGLETILFAFLALLSSYVFIKEEDRSSGWFSGILFGLLGLTRPEGLLFAGVAGLFRIWHLFRERKRPFRHDWVRLISFSIIIIGYFVWRYTYYGYLLPNTVYAKSMGLHPRLFIEGIYYAYQNFVFLGGFLFVALPIALAIFNPNKDKAVVYLFLNVLAYFGFSIISGGDWMPLQRFLVHILPMIYLLVQAGFSYLSQLWPKFPVRWLILFLVLGQSFFLIFNSIDQVLVEGEGRTIHHTLELENKINYLTQHVNPGDTIAVTQAGALSYFLPLDVRIVDMIGLTNAHIAHQSPKFPNGNFGKGDVFGKWDVDYVLAQEPSIVETMGAKQDEAGEWSTTFTGTTFLLNHPEFQELYTYDQTGFFVMSKED